MDFNLAVTFEVLPALLYGARLTILFAAASLVLGVALAVALNLLLLTKITVLRYAYNIYVSFVRGTPTLIQIFLFYYFLPILGVDLSASAAGTLALSVNLSAFAAEILRGAIASIPKGQTEASRALGLNSLNTFMSVILPQAFIRSIPALMNEFTFLVKSTPLLSVITVVELMRTGQQIFATNYRPLETLLGVALVFFCINITMSKAALFSEMLVKKRLGR
jgi:polar amino acid transport system permease protein